MHWSRERLWYRSLTLALVALVVLALAGCGGSQGETTETTETAPAEKSEVILSSTTSTQDSGLFDELIPAFEDANPEYEVKVVAVGTGEALRLGETKDADVLLVHAKSDEEKFVANGFGVERQDVMYNDFVLVGPSADPAGVKNAADIGAAMVSVAEAGGKGEAVFITRGDDSGTHKKELALWRAAEITTPTPEAQDWYESTGQGMGETLKIASEKAAYTLADRATFLSMRDSIDLEIVREGDPDLLNQYGVIVVEGAKNQEGGQAFFDWILSPDAQKLIGEFGVEEFGEPLFVPNAQ